MILRHLSDQLRLPTIPIFQTRWRVILCKLLLLIIILVLILLKWLTQLLIQNIWSLGLWWGETTLLWIWLWIKVSGQANAVSFYESTSKSLFVPKWSCRSIADRGLVKARALLKRKIESLLQTWVPVLNFLKEKAYSSERIIFVWHDHLVFLIHLFLSCTFISISCWDVMLLLMRISLMMTAVSVLLYKDHFVNRERPWVKITNDSTLPSFSCLFSGLSSRAQDVILITISFKCIIFLFEIAHDHSRWTLT